MALLIVNAVVYTVLKSRMMFYDSGTPTAFWTSLCSRLSEPMLHCDFLTCYISPGTQREPQQAQEVLCSTGGFQYHVRNHVRQSVPVIWFLLASSKHFCYLTDLAHAAQLPLLF